MCEKAVMLEFIPDWHKTQQWGEKTGSEGWIWNSTFYPWSIKNSGDV